MEETNKYLSYLKNLIIIIVFFIFASGWIMRLLGYPILYWGNMAQYHYFAVFFDPSINFILFIIGQIIAIVFVFLFAYFFEKSKNALIKRKFILDILKVIGVFLILNLIFIIALKVIGFPLKPYNLNRPEWPYFLGAIGIISVCVIVGLLYLYKKMIKDK